MEWNLPKAIAAFEHRDFRLFWFGQLISLMGTWMQNLAQSWLVLQLTNSPFLLGLASAIQFLPLLLFSLIAGVVADRTPKRLMLIGTQTGSMVTALMLGILTLTGAVRYWHVLILAGLLGTINAFDTPTRQSFVVEMVGKKHLMNAIVLNSSAFNAARVIGPALAGLAIGKLGMAPCFLINAASYLAVIFGLTQIRVPDQTFQKSSDTMVREQIGEGLRYIRETPFILSTFLLMALLSSFTMNHQVLVPVLAQNTLHQGAEGFGFLMTAMGIGAFTGSIFLAMISHRGPQSKLLLGGALGLCVFQLLLSLNNSYHLALFFLGMMGWSMITFVSSANTTIQVDVPDHLRGRVMSVYSLVFLGLAPIGSFLGGSIAQIGGAPAGLAAGAVIGMASLTAVLIWRQRHVHSVSVSRK